MVASLGDENLHLQVMFCLISAKTAFGRHAGGLTLTILQVRDQKRRQVIEIDEHFLTV